MTFHIYHYIILHQYMLMYQLLILYHYYIHIMSFLHLITFSYHNIINIILNNSLFNVMVITSNSFHNIHIIAYLVYKFNNNYHIYNYKHIHHQIRNLFMDIHLYIILHYHLHKDHNNMINK